MPDRLSRARALLRLPTPLLGGISPAEFMRDYWQRKPLLIRGAVPEVAQLFCADDLFTLASRDDVESRLVTRRRGRWQLEHGPLFADEAGGGFDDAYDDADDGTEDDEDGEPTFDWRQRLGPKHWSLLVQGVNLFDDDAAALLDRFRFIPDARLDDLMISYAADGGGVGPHFDSYDVFLLQAQGQRRWRISAQADLSLDPAQPMKILRNFVAEDEWVLEPGDMLYLPPHIAHDGIALGECMTCSIGFRAVDETELAVQFLHTLADRIATARAVEDTAAADKAASERASRGTRRRAAPRERLYRDPDQPAVVHPAALPDRLVAHTRDVLANIAWDDRTIGSFLCAYLSEPKPQVYFDPPRPMSRAVFLKRLLARGLRLDSRSRMLYDAHDVYLNGEKIDDAELLPIVTSHKGQAGHAASARQAADSGTHASRRALQKQQRDGLKLQREWLRQLADLRHLEADKFVTLAHDSSIVSLWHEWYLAGWIHLSSKG